MNRRDALSRVALILGGTIIGAEAFLSGCKNPLAKDVMFSADDVAFLDEVGETILPATSTPGAKEAKVGEFMKIMVTDCYDDLDQEIFIAGIASLKDASMQKYKKGFMDLSATEKHDLLVDLDKEAKDYAKGQKRDKPFHFKTADLNYISRKKYNRSFDRISDEEKDNLLVEVEDESKGYLPPHYFSMIKQLTITGYFTSEPGATKALRYVAVPGRYDGNYPYKKGDKAWAL